MKHPAYVARQAALAGAGILLLALGTGGTAAAQTSAAAPRWETWIGCWQPVATPEDTSADLSVKPVICVIPAADAAVDVVTVVDDKVAHREQVRAGERRRIEREGCTGWETVTGSADGRRAFRQSEFTCEGDLQRRSTGVMAMTADQWLDITGVSVGGYTDVQVIRYRPTSAPAALEPADVSALQGRALAVDAARLAAAAPVTSDDVVEALRHLSPEVVEAWLVERGQGFAMDARKLFQLADAGVPERVIDLMVALSYPDVFAINRDAREGQPRPDPETGHNVRPRPVYGWGGYPGYGWGGYYPGYGYGGYGGGYWGYPVIIEKDSNEGSRGRAVKGRGYTRGSSGSSGGSIDSTRPSGSRSGTASGSGSSGSGSSSGSTRKAKPRGGE